VDEIRSVGAKKPRPHDEQFLTTFAEYGKERVESLTGLDDKAIEGKVTEAVKANS